MLVRVVVENRSRCNRSTERHVSAGDILDHVYEGQVTVILPVKVPATARAGTSISLSAKITYLVCEDVCLPGTAEVQLTLAVVESTEVKPSEDARLFTAARGSIPKPPPQDGTVITRWEADVLIVRCKDAAELTFFPHQDGATVADLLDSGNAGGGELLLKASAGGKPVRGVLAVRKGGQDTPTAHYWVDVPQPGLATLPAGER